MTLDPRLLKIMRDGNAAQRRYICERAQDGFIYFAIYYFAEYFPYELAEFHFDMEDDLQAILEGAILDLVWEMFRESAKTTLARIFVVYCICHLKKHYINWDSYDEANAEAALFMVATALQGNKKIIADYGQLYYLDPHKKKTSKIQRLGNFVTANGVKCEAFSTQKSTRGRIWNEFRPDLFILDDFETNKTKRSVAVINSIIGHIDELRAGLNRSAATLYLCNRISESGVVVYLEDVLKDDPKARIHRVDVEQDGEPSWPARFAMTDDEANALNAGIPDPRRKVESLESKRKRLTDRVYGPEYLNKPAAAGDLIFDRAKVEKAIEEAKVFQKEHPPENRGGFITYRDYLPHHRYAIGGDTAKGVGRDSNAAVGFDFTTRPAEQVSSYANKWIAPDVFGDELAREGKHFGECLLVPELNNTGYATITKLKGSDAQGRPLYDLGKIYRQRQTGKNVRVGDTQPVILGFDTNGATKSTLIYEFKTAFEDGHVRIWDVDLLKEMWSFNQADLQQVEKQLGLEDEVAGGMTRHHDKLMAACLAWVGRHFAEVSQSAKEQYVQAPPELGEFEAGHGSTATRPNFVSDGFNHVVRLDEAGAPQAPYEAGEFEH